MEFTITNHCDNSFGFAESKKGKAEFRKNVNFSKNLTKEPIAIYNARQFRL